MSPFRALAAAIVLITTPALAGVVGGPFTVKGTVKSMDVAYYYALAFERGKVATLHAESTNGEDIDCYVYAPNGDVLAVDTTPASTCDLHWKPTGSGKVTVAVWNMSRVAATYTLTTN